MINLMTLIAHVESNNNPHAMRFEPAVLEKVRGGRWQREVLQARAANRVSFGTADMIVSTSWGKYQIMGFNLYGGKAPYVGDIPTFLWDPPPAALQDAAFARFVATGGFDPNIYPAQMDVPWRLKFATFYNGPGQPEVYAKRMEEVLAQLGG